MRGRGEDQRLDRVGSALAVIAVVALLAAQFSLFLSQPLGFDDAFNVQIPVSLVRSGRYETTYHQPTLFDYRISTGPTVLVPVAAVLALLEPTYWSVRLPMALYLLAYILGLERLSRRLAARPERAWMPFLMMLAGFVLVPSGLATSAQVLGSLPAAAFFLWGIEVMSRALERGRTATAVAAGVLLGLAVVTKLIALLWVGGLLFALWFAPELAGSLRRRRAFLLACAAGVGAPLLLWQSVILIGLGYEGQRQWLRDFWRMMWVAGSGVSLGALRLSALGPAAHLETVSSMFAVGKVPLLLGFAIAALFTARVFLARQRPFAAHALLLATAAHLLWWFGLSTWLWYWHLLPGYFLYATLIGYVLYVSVTEAGRRMGWVIGALIGLAVWWTLPLRPPSLSLQPNLVLDGQLQAAQVLRRIRSEDPAARFWGLGWFQCPELSFLVRESFKDLTREAPAPGAANYFSMGKATNFFVTGVGEYAKANCAEDVFDGANYRICRLRPEAPQAPVPQ